MTQPAVSARAAIMPLSAIALTVLIHVFWGANAVAVKVGLVAVPPLWSGFFRFAIGVLCVLLWARLAHLPVWPRRHEWRPLAVLSLMFTVQIAIMNWGFGMTSGIMSTILLSTFPLWAALFALWLIPDQRLNWHQAAGLLVAFAGAALVVAGDADLGQLGLTDIGNLVVIVSAALLGLRIAFAGRIVTTIDPARLTVWMMLFSLPVFALGGALTESIAWERLDWRPVLALLYQGVIVAGFCFSVNYVLMRRYNPAIIASYGFLEPISGVLASAWILGELLSWWLAAGAAAVGLGLLLITRRR